MDAFYASIEQRDFPELKGKPIAVGGGSKRGVTTTASYEARKFGVKSAMPGYIARQKCPDLIFVPPRFDVYKEVSKQIREVFQQYTDVIEPLSLDEAYLDVTQNKKNQPIATLLARDIKDEVRKKTNLTCSAGVSYNKFLAKIASDMNKPDGLTIIKPHQAQAFLDGLAIGKFHGVGKVTRVKMEKMGIQTGRDLRKLSRKQLVNSFGKMGQFFFNVVRGEDHRKVETNRPRKSLGVERTLEENLASYEEILPYLEDIIEKFYERLKRSNSFGRTITLKLKTADFKVITRAHSEISPISDQERIDTVAKELLKSNIDSVSSIRLLGLTSSNFESPKSSSYNEGQLRLEF